MRPTALLLAVALGGCGLVPGRDEAPAWVRSAPVEPGALFSVGSGGGRDAAISSARAELARSLRVSIDASSRALARAEDQRGSRSGRSERFESSYVSDARSSARIEDLPGVTVVEVVAHAGETWALLRLDRAAWAEDLRAGLAANDQALAALALPPAASAASAAKLLRAGAPLWAERERLVAGLRLAAPGVLPPNPPFDKFAWQHGIDLALAGIGLDLIAGAELAQLRPLLAEACARQGILLAANAPLRLALDLDVREQRVAISDQSQWRLDGMLSGRVLDANQRELGGFTLSERASAGDAAEARRRLLAKLADRLAADLDRRLVEFIAR